MSSVSSKLTHESTATEVKYYSPGKSHLVPVTMRSLASPQHTESSPRVVLPKEDSFVKPAKAIVDDDVGLPLEDESSSLITKTKTVSIFKVTFMDRGRLHATEKPLQTGLLAAHTSIVEPQYELLDTELYVKSSASLIASPPQRHSSKK
jgi:hypothetical protein